MLAVRLSSQDIEIEIHSLSTKHSKPFWLASNNNGIYQNGSILNFKIREEKSGLFHKINLSFLKPFDFNEILFYDSELTLKKQCVIWLE